MLLVGGRGIGHFGGNNGLEGIKFDGRGWMDDTLMNQYFDDDECGENLVVAEWNGTMDAGRKAARIGFY